MADQEIDRLLLEIEVEDKTQGGSKKLVDEFATAISKLQAEINKLDTSKLEAVSKALSFSGVGGGGAKGTSAVGKQSEEVKKLNSELKNLQKTREDILKQKVLGDASLGDILATDKEGKTSVVPEKVATQLYDEFGLNAIDKQIEEVQTKLSQAQIPQAQGGMGEQLQQVENVAHKQLELNSLRDVQTAQLDIINKKLQDENLSEEEQVRLKKQALSLEKALNGTGEKNLLSAIKRVAIYRAIRGALKAIVNTFKEGFGNLAQFSDEVNQKMSQLTSSFTIIKNSVAVAFLPLLNAIVPIVQKVAQGIAEVANAISYLSALLTKSSTYLKVNTEYFKEMNKQARLLSFDTFEKLQGGNDIEKMFSEESVKDAFSVNEELGKSLTTLGLISGVVVTIGTSKLITWLKGGGLQKVADILGGDMFTNLSAIGGIVAGVWMAIDGIHGILDWDETTSGLQKAFDILKTILGVAAALAGTVAVIMAMTGGAAGAVKVASAISLGLAASAMFVKAAEVGTIKNHAFGGDYNSADLFYANENGQTELIASTNSGGGAVMNMQQLESAIYSGMVKAMASGENGESAIYLDGNKVGTFIAGNNGFRSEANRRNTGLNWR